MSEKGFSFQSINNCKRSLRAAFFIAMEDTGHAKREWFAVTIYMGGMG